MKMERSVKDHMNQAKELDNSILDFRSEEVIAGANLGSSGKTETFDPDMPKYEFLGVEPDFTACQGEFLSSTIRYDYDTSGSELLPPQSFSMPSTCTTTSEKAVSRCKDLEKSPGEDDSFGSGANRSMLRVGSPNEKEQVLRVDSLGLVKSNEKKEESVANEEGREGFGLESQTPKMDCSDIESFRSATSGERIPGADTGNDSKVQTASHSKGKANPTLSRTKKWKTPAKDCTAERYLEHEERRKKVRE
jgi:hypothetical protein